MDDDAYQNGTNSMLTSCIRMSVIMSQEVFIAVEKGVVWTRQFSMAPGGWQHHKNQKFSPERGLTVLQSLAVQCESPMSSGVGDKSEVSSSFSTSSATNTSLIAMHELSTTGATKPANKENPKIKLRSVRLVLPSQPLRWWGLQANRWTQKSKARKAKQFQAISLHLSVCMSHNYSQSRESDSNSVLSARYCL